MGNGRLNRAGRLTAWVAGGGELARTTAAILWLSVLRSLNFS
jgi:hypothetical protein